MSDVIAKKKKKAGFLKPIKNDKIYSFLRKFYCFLRTTPSPKYLVSLIKPCLYLHPVISIPFSFPASSPPKLDCLALRKVFDKIFQISS